MNSKNIKVAIIGAAGYTGEELIRLLTRHPMVEITCITSREHAGKSIGYIFPRFFDLKLKFSAPDLEIISKTAELIFLCLPHGLAAEYAVPLHKAGRTIVDLSADFRLNNPENYDHYYGCSHPAPQLLSEAIYGLPEYNRQQLKAAKLVACPGCYPTSILLPVIPFLKKKLCETNALTVCSLSGVTGAGRKIDAPYLFPECNESIRSYSITNHRHIPEIEQELAKCLEDGRKINLNFIPHLIPINRGLHSTISLNASDPNLEIETIASLLRDFYDQEPFVRILPYGKLPDTKNVVLTNICEIGFDFNVHTGKIILTSAIDNLTKGAAGQAVQCMNIICNYKETLGLL